MQFPNRNLLNLFEYQVVSGVKFGYGRKRTKTQFTAVLMGESARPLVPAIGAYGVSSVVLVRHDAMDDYAPAAWAEALVQLMKEKDPEVIMAAGPDRVNEVMAHAPAKTDLPMAANCCEIRAGDPFEITRFRWGSSRWKMR